MHDQRIAARGDDGRGHRIERLFGILVVDAEPAFDGDRHAHRSLHRRDAIADQHRLRHQAGAEPALLHAVRRAADIEIDFVIAEIGANARGRGERRGVRSAELDRDRMLGRVIGEQPRAVAAQHRRGRDHFGVEQRAPRQQAVEEPAVPVGPLHHRGDAESAIEAVHSLISCAFGSLSLSSAHGSDCFWRKPGETHSGVENNIA